FNDNEIAKLKSVFDIMAEGQSSLAVATLRGIFNKAQVGASEQQLNEQQRAQCPEEGLRKVFELLDKDKKGVINAEDLRQGLLDFGETVTEDELQRMMRSADVDGDGMINFEEFVKIMTPSRVNGQK
ncbi:hypothetical protein BDB00DRAFT_759439, partial [Zychaea mexicana]|uniref:uncharacterized protein n=1 Tax=Zychaea mexicana TaxID=64656 RepID=UPI0022FE43F9